MTPDQIKQITKDLWPKGCLEDGDNDPVTRYLDGYCRGIEDFQREVLKLMREK